MKEKCVFCDYSGFEENEDLAFANIDMNVLDIRSSAWLSCNRTDVANGETPKLCVDVTLVSDDGEEVVNKMKSIPIRFCPVCGRDLTKDTPPKLHKLSDFVDDGYFSTISYNALRRNGIMYIEDLELFTEKTVSKLRGLGKKGMMYLKKFMDNNNLKFAENDVLDDIFKNLHSGDRFQFTNSDGIVIKNNIFCKSNYFEERNWHSYVEVYTYDDNEFDDIGNFVGYCNPTTCSLTLREAASIVKVS